MTQQDLLNEFVSLTPDAQRQVTDFVSFLRQKYQTQTQTPTRKNMNLHDEKFIGMWSDRQDMDNSTDWVRNIRENEWSK
jgi:hypothetical protein